MPRTISNRGFRVLTVIAVVLLAPGLFVLGLIMIIATEPNTAPGDVGTAFVSGSVTSAAFFAVGWFVQRNATRRRETAELVTAVAADLVELRNAAELAKFYIRLNHSAPTYRDRIARLIAGLGTVRENIESLTRFETPPDNAESVRNRLKTLAAELEDLRKECHERYPALSAIAKADGDDTDKHLAELSTFGVLTAALDIRWEESSYQRWEPPPLVVSINAALASLRREQH